MRLSGSALKAVGKEAENEEEFDEDLEISRFRPNIVIGGCSDDMGDEDQWAHIQFHTQSALDAEASQCALLTLDVTGPCSRCKMININQSTGAMDGRYLQTLSEYRKSGSRVNFGQFLAFSEDAMSNHYGEKAKDDDLVSLRNETTEIVDSRVLYLAEGMTCSLLLK